MTLGLSGEVLNFHASNPFILPKYTEKKIVTKLIEDKRMTRQLKQIFTVFDGILFS